MFCCHTNKDFNYLVLLVWRTVSQSDYSQQILPNRWVYKGMYSLCVMAHNGCFGTVGGCGKRKDTEGAELQRPARSTGQQWWVADGPSVREEHPQKPRRANPASSAHNTWVSTGTFPRELVDGSGISHQTFSRVIPDVLRGIIGLSQQYIKFPYTVSEQENKNAQFAAMSSFPNVIGATNCTHVAIRAPSENELGRHWCPPSPPSTRHSGGIPWWSPPVSHPAGWAPVGPFPCPWHRRSACVTPGAFLLPLLCLITFCFQFGHTPTFWGNSINIVCHMLPL